MRVKDSHRRLLLAISRVPAAKLGTSGTYSATVLLVDLLPFAIGFEEGVYVGLMVPFQSLPVVFDLKIHGELALFVQLLLVVLFLFARLQFVDLQEIFADADGIVELDLPESLKGFLEHCDLGVLADLFLHRINGLTHFFQRHLDIGKLLFSG